MSEDYTNIIKGAETIKKILLNAEGIEISKNGNKVKIVDAKIKYGKGAIQYSKNMNTLKFQGSIVLKRVTDFYIELFPKSHSIIYGIQLGNEHIRGYVVLVNVK